MTVYDRKKPSFISKLLLVFKPKPSADIVSYADKIIDDYTGITGVRNRKKERRRKRAALVSCFVCSAFIISILWFSFKIFF